MDDDPELAAIRARLRDQLTRAPGSPAVPAAPSAAPTEPVTVTDRTVGDLIARSDALVLDLWAPWCGPCRQMAPAIDALARHFAGRVTFAKLNIDENPATANAYAVQSIPTLLAFRRGRLVDRWVGALPQASLAMKVKGLVGA